MRKKSHRTRVKTASDKSAPGDLDKAANALPGNSGPAPRPAYSGVPAGTPKVPPFAENSGVTQEREYSRLVENMKDLRKEFQSKAEHYGRMAEKLDKAILELGTNGKMTPGATGVKAFPGAGAKTVFKLLIDESVSMYGAPLVAASEAAVAVQQLDRKGFYQGYPQVIYPSSWGGEPRPGVLEAAVENMDRLSTISGPELRIHFIVISDGDCYDREESFSRLVNMLQRDSRTTLDFILLGGAGKILDKLAGDLAPLFPERIGLRHVDMPVRPPGRDQRLSGAVTEAAMDVCSRHLKADIAQADVSPSDGIKHARRNPINPR